MCFTWLNCRRASNKVTPVPGMPGPATPNPVTQSPFCPEVEQMLLDYVAATEQITKEKMVMRRKSPINTLGSLELPQPPSEEERVKERQKLVEKEIKQWVSNVEKQESIHPSLLRRYTLLRCTSNKSL